MNISAAIHMLGQTPPRMREAIDALSDALAQQRRMADALHVLEDLSSRREPYWHAFDLVPVVQEVVSLVRTDAIARQIAFDVQIVGEVAPIVGDVTLVRHALLNVVLDALEATSMSKRQFASVKVSIAQVGDCVEVVVEHFGARGDDGGSGRGSDLALARSVIDAHGADISVNGDSDAGIVVRMRWPSRFPVRPD